MDAPKERTKVDIHITLDKELRDIAAADCARRNVNLNEVISELLAQHYDREDLRRVPRKRLGRPIGSTKTKAKKGKQPK